MNTDPHQLLEAGCHVELWDGKICRDTSRFDVDGSLKPFCGIENDIRPATLEEIHISLDAHNQVDYAEGERACDGMVWKDEDCYPYAARSCAICGRGLGMI
jgi:hypothetical protein